ncbi:MAG: Na(+)/H(+) antiporter subunit C, partial [Corynebacterium flavescens]|nr:Na(+)/H(+) antiporter subunit C [Corynebacterium flavescens]
ASNDPATGRATKEGDQFGPEFFEEPVKGASDD